MKTSVARWLSALAVLGMAVPLHALDVSGRTSALPASVTDVALTGNADLAGVVVGRDGRPAAHAPVQVWHNQTIVAGVRTDANGRYTVQGLRSGVHVVRTPHGQKVCRFWSAAAAPPAAQRGLVLVSDGTVIRGQNRGGMFRGATAGTGVGIGLFAGAVVAVAASVDDDDDPAPTPPPSASP